MTDEHNHDDASAGELLVYVGEDGRARIHVRFEDGTIWLSQRQMGELYGKDVRTINEHLKNVYDEGELAREATIRKLRMVRTEGNRSVSRDVEHYALPAILAVGYRVRSPMGTRFRQWATARLEELLVKGFVLDDERMKRAGEVDYFDELLARVRDIRSSEKVFYKKVLEIYATSVDYDPRAEASLRFFQTVQNKMHYAAHGRTAAELIDERADASRPNMGLTSFPGLAPRKADARIAKNYLEAEELETLNRIVTAYLEFAELQAMNRRPMRMVDWMKKLDDFLRLGDRALLTNAGTVSHEAALAKAEAEYERFRASRAALPSPVERDFEAVAKRLEAEGKKSPARKRRRDA